MNKDIEALIVNALHNEFSGLPVRIEESPEDDRILCVMVFSVPDDKLRAVRNAIYALKKSKLPESDITLLPMVKDIETTVEYYPEYALPMPAKSSSLADLVFDCVTFSRDDESWKSPKRYYPATCANTEYALAA